MIGYHEFFVIAVAPIGAGIRCGGGGVANIFIRVYITQNKD